jgi:hypothetical protein
MPPSKVEVSQEALRDPIEIPDEDAITIHEALVVATSNSFVLGKSTLQRWAKFWYDHPGGAVRCLLVTTRAGNFYKLSREDFKVWVFDQKQNEKPHEAPQDLIRPLETPLDLSRPREVSRETRDEGNQNRFTELENENFQLKIDVGVRKQLLDRAREEMEDLRTMANNLLRENGALQYQILQLAPPSMSKGDTTNGEPAAPAPDNLPPTSHNT